MKKRAISICVIAMTAVLATPAAHAQQRSAAGMPNTRDLTGNRESYGDLERRIDLERLYRDPVAAAQAYDTHLTIAKCIVGLSGDRASSLLGGPKTDDPGYSDLNKAMSGRYKNCAPRGELGGLSPSLLSFAIAEKLVIRNESSGEEDRATQVDKARATAFHGDMQNAVTLDSVARCVVVYSPGLALKILKADSGSAEEATALETLYSRTPECGIAHMPADVTPVIQRTAIAESLYAWSHRDD